MELEPVELEPVELEGSDVLEDSDVLEPDVLEPDVLEPDVLEGLGGLGVSLQTPSAPKLNIVWAFTVGTSEKDSKGIPAR